MNITLSIIAAVALAPLVAHCDEPTILSVRFVSAKVLPTGWSVSSVDAPAVPYGLVKRPGENSGLAVTLVGTKKTKGLMGEPAQESLTVYVMPKGFVGGQPPPPGAQHFPAKLLGQAADGCPIYIMRWSQIESWPEWEKNIHDYFVKKEPNV